MHAIAPLHHTSARTWNLVMRHDKLEECVVHTDTAKDSLAWYRFLVLDLKSGSLRESTGTTQ